MITGSAGDLDAGLYAPENVTAVYDEVLRRAQLLLGSGSTVILDGTWRDARQRERARELADETASPIVEFTCSVPLEGGIGEDPGQDGVCIGCDATDRRRDGERSGGPFDGHPIDTSRPLADSVAEAQQICCLAI